MLRYPFAPETPMCLPPGRCMAGSATHGNTGAAAFIDFTPTLRLATSAWCEVGASSSHVCCASSGRHPHAAPAPARLPIGSGAWPDARSSTSNSPTTNRRMACSGMSAYDKLWDSERVASVRIVRQCLSARWCVGVNRAHCLRWLGVQECQPHKGPEVGPNSVRPNHAGRDGLPGIPHSDDSNRLAGEQGKRSPNFCTLDREVDGGGLALHLEGLRLHHEA